MGDNSGSWLQVVGSSKELTSEIQRLQLIVEHQKSTLEQKETEIANLKKIIGLLENKFV